MPRPREFQEGDVIAAARDEFLLRGYGSTSVDKLSSVTGLGKGSLYGAFGDKHGLFMRVLNAYVDAHLNEVRTLLRDTTYAAYDRLTRHIEVQIEHISADKSLLGCLMSKSAAERSACDDIVKRTIEGAYRTWVGELAACIGEAQRDAAIDACCDPQTLATVMMAFMRGQEALHVGGMKSDQLKASAEQMIALLPR